jgi:hypothetical protein
MFLHVVGDQTHLNHIQPYPTISNHIQPYPTISNHIYVKEGFSLLKSRFITFLSLYKNASESMFPFGRTLCTYSSSYIHEQVAKNKDMQDLPD